MLYYTAPTYLNRNDLEYVGRNRNRSIFAAKRRAAEIKQSVSLFARESVNDDWLYLAIAEYPYFKRGLILDPKDIRINYFD